MSKKTIKELCSYLIIILIVVLIRKFLITPVRVDGGSMNPTLRDGEIMILNKIKYKTREIKRFDIVVIEHDNELLIKRVIGLPGETIEYKDNILYVNGKKVKETFKHAKTNDYSLKEDIGYDKIPKNTYFVMGDNRVNSLDSRYFGPVNVKDINGSASLVLFPFSKIGIKK